jgi:hypothetical protein
MITAVFDAIAALAAAWWPLAAAALALGTAGAWFAVHRKG